MKVIQYFPIQINSLKISYLLVSCFLLVFIYGVYLSSNIIDLDTKIINKSLEPVYVITPYPSWHDYGQLQDDRTLSINGLENDNQQVPNSEINKSVNVDNTETQKVSVFKALFI